jgi:hypothetical protein
MNILLFLDTLIYLVNKELFFVIIATLVFEICKMLKTSLPFGFLHYVLHDVDCYNAMEHVWGLA